jgi:Protein of unknown function (DUF2851)
VPLHSVLIDKIMREDFLCFLWQSQYFNKTNLTTDAGEALQIVAVGQQNTNAGPDFLNARLILDGLEWVGAVEIHVKSSEWHRHAHTNNHAYDGVILHLIWENDALVTRPDGTTLPTLSLKNRTNVSLFKKYEDLVQNPSPIACQAQFDTINELTKITMLDRAVMNRLERKAEFVNELYKRNQHDWEETAYQLLANNFGFKINAEPFLRLAQNLPLKVLQKHRDNLTQIEAMVFGTAGFLNSPTDDYGLTLKREYDFLSAKYNLKINELAIHEWKFLRLRPANFPTIRLAQWAALMQTHSSLFSLFVNTHSIEVFSKSMKLKTSDYWQKHYQLGKESSTKIPALGMTSAQNIIINTVVPLLVAYSQQKDNRDFLDQALDLINALPAEHNHITDSWAALGLKINSASDSQGVIELYNNFCVPKRCLSCGIGVALVR